MRVSLGYVCDGCSHVRIYKSTDTHNTLSDYGHLPPDWGRLDYRQGVIMTRALLLCPTCIATMLKAIECQSQSASPPASASTAAPN